MTTCDCAAADGRNGGPVTLEGAAGISGVATSSRTYCGQCGTDVTFSPRVRIESGSWRCAACDAAMHAQARSPVSEPADRGGESSAHQHAHQPPAWSTQPPPPPPAWNGSPPPLARPSHTGPRRGWLIAAALGGLLLIGSIVTAILMRTSDSGNRNALFRVLEQRRTPSGPLPAPSDATLSTVAPVEPFDTVVVNQPTDGDVAPPPIEIDETRVTRGTRRTLPTTVPVEEEDEVTGPDRDQLAERRDEEDRRQPVTGTERADETSTDSIRDAMKRRNATNRR